MRPRVGHIQFLNCLPLYYGLVKSQALLDVELIKGTPTELNSLLINGGLDISPISSIEYARNNESLVLFPDFTVSSDDEVKSILLLSRFSLDKLDGKRVALTSTSATSHVLVKLILRGYGLEPEYVTCRPDLDDMLSVADAALLIGDMALKYYVDARDFYLYDLGAEWKKLTGKKMVYAVWAVRRSFAEEQTDTVQYIFDIFKTSMDYSKQHLSEIAEYAARWESFSSSFLTDYFNTLRFDFDKEYQEGLLHFYRLASEIGELRTAPDLRFANVRPGAGV